jgi:hypothetical protein
MLFSFSESSFSSAFLSQLDIHFWEYHFQRLAVLKSDKLLKCESAPGVMDCSSIREQRSSFCARLRFRQCTFQSWWSVCPGLFIICFCSLRQCQTSDLSLLSLPWWHLSWDWDCNEFDWRNQFYPSNCWVDALTSFFVFAFSAVNAGMRQRAIAAESWMQHAKEETIWSSNCRVHIRKGNLANGSSLVQKSEVSSTLLLRSDWKSKSLPHFREIRVQMDD